MVIPLKGDYKGANLAREVSTFISMMGTSSIPQFTLDYAFRLMSIPRCLDSFCEMPNKVEKPVGIKKCYSICLYNIEDLNFDWEKIEFIEFNLRKVQKTKLRKTLSVYCHNREIPFYKDNELPEEFLFAGKEQK